MFTYKYLHYRVFIINRHVKLSFNMIHKKFTPVKILTRGNSKSLYYANSTGLELLIMHLD